MTSSSTGADAGGGGDAPELHVGQAVRWRSSGGATRGRIVRRLVRDQSQELDEADLGVTEPMPRGERLPDVGIADLVQIG